MIVHGYVDVHAARVRPERMCLLAHQQSWHFTHPPLCTLHADFGTIKPIMEASMRLCRSPPAAMSMSSSRASPLSASHHVPPTGYLPALKTEVAWPPLLLTGSQRHVPSHVPAEGPAPLVNHHESPTSIDAIFVATVANSCMPSSTGVMHQAPIMKTVVAKAVKQTRVTSLPGPFDSSMLYVPGQCTNIELNPCRYTWNDSSNQQPEQQQNMKRTTVKSAKKTTMPMISTWPV